jgi:hypothetical protein
MLPEPVKRFCALSLIACTVFLTACGTKTPPPPDYSPQLPPAPSLSTPLPSEPYSRTAARRMEGWQRNLMGTQVMSAPSGKPGQ